MNAFTNVDWQWALAFLVDCAIKGSIVIVLAAAIAWMLRRSSAAARHSVWSAAVAAQLLIPVFGLLLPTWRVSLVEAPAWTAPAQSIDAGSETATIPVASNPKSSTPANNDQAAAETRRPALPTNIANAVSPIVIGAAIWVLGAIAVLLRLAIGTAVVSRMAARGERVVDEKWLGMMHRLAVGLGISRPLTLLRGDSVGVPVTWGIVYPVVFLPREADEWPEERRRYVLVHEMAHVKRLDAFTQLVAQIAAAVFWFNPLVWVAVSRMRRERENACDDYVLAHGTRPSEYASDLLELVRSIGTEGHRGAAPAFAALAMARRSEFEGRMLSILDPRVRRSSLSTAKVTVSGVAALLIVAPLAAFSPFDASARAVAIRSAEVPATTTPSAESTLPMATTRQVASARPAAPVSSAANASSTVIGTSFSGIAGSACDRLVSTTSSSSHINEDDGSPSTRRIQLLRRSPGYCFEAALNGRITFSNDDREITSMSPEARVRFREHTASFDREIVVSPAGDGLRREYYERGKPAAFDEAAQRWYTTMLLTAIRESGINARARISRIAQTGGANAVLQEIGTIQSSGAKRGYYMAYLQSPGTLTDRELAQLIRQARADLAGSSGDLSTMLAAAGAHGLKTEESRDAFTSAAMAVESDGDKTRLLTQVVMTADRELLLDIMRVARTIDSDGDKSRLLITAAAKYLTGRDTDLRESFFDIVETLESDGDRSRVLVSAAAYGHGDDAVTLACIRGTHAMDSSGDKATVLISIASRKLLTTKVIKDAMMFATNKIDSDSDRARVLSVIIGG